MSRSASRVLDIQCPTCHASLLTADREAAGLQECRACGRDFCDRCGHAGRELCESCNETFEREFEAIAAAGA